MVRDIADLKVIFYIFCVELFFLEWESVHKWSFINCNFKWYLTEHKGPLF